MTELVKIMTALEKLEGVLSATSEKADNELKSLGKVSADTKAAMDNLGIQQREFADRLSQLEQKGFQNAPAEHVDSSWGAQLVKASILQRLVALRGQVSRDQALLLPPPLAREIGLQKADPFAQRYPGTLVTLPAQARRVVISASARA